MKIFFKCEDEGTFSYFFKKILKEFIASKAPLQKKSLKFYSGLEKWYRLKLWSSEGALDH